MRKHPIDISLQIIRLGVPRVIDRRTISTFYIQQMQNVHLVADGRSDGADAWSFRRLRRDDLQLLVRWLTSEHVKTWWGEPRGVEEEYFDVQEPVDRFLSLLDGRPVGMVQACRWSDFPDEARAVGAHEGELGIDYLLGEAELIGRGLVRRC